MAPTFGLIGELLDELPHIVPLERVESEVRIQGFVAGLELKLVYRNDKSSAIQASYRCPIDVKAALYHFEAKLDKRVIKASCLEKENAKKIYKEAVESGTTVIFAGEDDRTSDILDICLGNLPPNETVEIQLRLVQKVTVGTGGEVTFTLPTVFHPRYTPAEGPTSSGSPFGSVCEVITTKPYTMYINVEVIGCHKISEIKSLKDKITVDISNDELSAKVSQDDGFTMDHDWTMYIYHRNPYNVHLLRETGDHTTSGLLKDDLLAINYFPEVPVNSFSPHNELIFVIDRSGSMQGERIESAKSALLLFLKSLPHGCRFNIISFGSSFQALFPEPSVRYTEATLKEALKLQMSMDADLGGTEILEVLKHIYSKPPTAGYSRQMIVITDGAVFNVNEVLQSVSLHAENTRVFAVGIGEGASSSLVEGIARSGGGRHEMVFKTEQLQTKVMGLVASMLQFNVTDFKLTCNLVGDNQAKMIPKIPPVIFGGQHLLLYARIPAKSEVEDLSLSGKIDDKSFQWDLKETDIRTVHDGNLALHRLAAKAQIKQWELQQGDSKEEIIEMSQASNVLSKYTAMVGVDQDGKTFKKAQASSWAGFNQCMRGTPLNMMGTGASLFRSMPSSNTSMAFGGTCLSVPRGTGTLFNFSPSFSPAPPPPVPASGLCSFVTFGSSGSRLPPPPSVYKKCQTSSKHQNNPLVSSIPLVVSPQMSFVASTNTLDKSDKGQTYSDTIDSSAILDSSSSRMCYKDKMMIFVSAQNFDGSWNFIEIEHYLGTKLNLDDMKTALGCESEAALATLAAVAIMRYCFSSRKSEWVLIEFKAVNFLKYQQVEIDRLVEKVADFLKIKEI